MLRQSLIETLLWLLFASSYLIKSKANLLFISHGALLFANFTINYDLFEAVMYELGVERRKLHLRLNFDY